MKLGPDLGWLKALMPRGLYGRAVLILLLPIFSLVFVVTVMFLQRHFEDVTRQMTASSAREIALIVDRIDRAPDMATARAEAQKLADELGMSVSAAADGVAAGRVFYDISGRFVTRELREKLPMLRAVDLTALREVRVVLDTRHRAVLLTFPRSRVSASNPHQLLVLLGVTALLMTLIAGLFLRNQLRPIRRLAKAAEDYGRGRLTPYKPSGATEVRSAGAAFLDMRNRLERLAESRAMMLSGISHDLRTPLTRLQLSLSMLTPDTPPEAEDIEAMRRDVEEMSEMLNAFLAFARDAAHDAPAQPVRLFPMLEKIAEDAARSGQEIHLRAAQESREIGANIRADLLRRAVENLVCNALRYADRIELTLTQSDRSICIAVDDNGPGIPQSQRENAMRPFFRLDPARSRRRGGGAAGLGLSIAADAARSHGGTLRLVDSKRLGGLRAEIVLPK